MRGIVGYTGIIGNHAALKQQLLACHVAKACGCPIDQPRNPAGSVTAG